jgi:hypothetical protein
MLIASIANPDLALMLTVWRQSRGPFVPGGGGLPLFGRACARKQ